MFEQALNLVHQKGGTLWSLGERNRDGAHEWYAAIHITVQGKTFCSSGIAATPEGAIEGALAMAATPLPSIAEVQSRILAKRPNPLGLKINL